MSTLDNAMIGCINPGESASPDYLTAGCEAPASFMLQKSKVQAVDALVAAHNKEQQQFVNHIPTLYPGASASFFDYVTAVSMVFIQGFIFTSSLCVELPAAY